MEGALLTETTQQTSVLSVTIYVSFYILILKKQHFSTTSSNVDPRVSTIY